MFIYWHHNPRELPTPSVSQSRHPVSCILSPTCSFVVVYFYVHHSFSTMELVQDTNRNSAPWPQDCFQSSSCLGPENSSCEMKPFLSLSSCWNISSTNLSWSSNILFTSSLSAAPSWSAATICFFKYSLTWKTVPASPDVRNWIFTTSLNVHREQPTRCNVSQFYLFL